MAACRSLIITIVFAISMGLAQSALAQVIVLDASGTALGTLVDDLSPSPGLQPALKVPYSDSPPYTWHSSYWIINEKSYQFVLEWPNFDYDTGEVLPNATLRSPDFYQFLYESQDCTGQAFVATRHSGIVFPIVNLSGAAGADESQSIYYVPIDEGLQNRSFLSQLRWDTTTDECEPLSDVAYYFSGRAYLNDPIETGLTDSTPPMPLQLRSEIDPALARCIFRDGFECEA